MGHDEARYRGADRERHFGRADHGAHGRAGAYAHGGRHRRARQGECMKRLAAAASLLLVLCGYGAVTGANAEERNPFENDTAAITIGTSLFAARCADCHGPDAKGKLGPDLTLRWARGETDESAFRIIRNGVPGSSMPPNIAPDSELWAIVAYLRSISVVPVLVSTGDAGRGREQFAKHCAECHQARGAGGAFGPDLTSIGITRSRAALTAALREPSASIALGFRAVTLRTRGGERATG